MIRTILKTYTTMNFRSPWIWSVTGTCLALLFLRSRSGIQGAAGFAFLFSGEGLVMSIFFLGQMLATVEEAHRNTDMRIREPLESLPYHPAEWVTGRLLAQYFSWLAAGDRKSVV